MELLDWEDSNTEREFRHRLRRWLEENLDREWVRRLERMPVAERIGPLRDWQRRLHDAGYVGVTWPREYGGRGGTQVEQVIALDELARAGAPHDIFRVGVGLIGPSLIAIATPAQRRRLLPPMLDGRALWCQGFSESEAGSDLAAIRARARRKGDGWVLDGQKLWTTYGHHADHCLLLTRTGEPSSRHRGLTAFAVPMDRPGIEARPIRHMGGDSEFAELFLDGLEVGIDDLIGEPDGGWSVAMTMLGFERLMISNWGFVCARVLREMDSERMTPGQRDRFRRLVLKGRLVLLNAYRFAVTTGSFPGGEPSMQKLQSTELLRDVFRLAHETAICRWPGGAAEPGRDGSEPPFGRELLTSYGMTIAGGTSEIQRNLLAERALGLPR
jgi:alkylation response protein AidB-like acyl-CoA dehydrogenase